MQIFRTDRPLAPSYDLIRPSIRLIRENIWAVLYLNFFPNLLLIVGLVLASSITDQNPPITHYDTRTSLGLALAFAGALWALLAYPGLILLQIKAAAGEHPTPMACFKQGLPRLLPLIFMSILAVLLVMLGFIALIIPGLILIRGFYLAPYYIVEQNIGPVEALKKCFADSKPNAGYIWGVIGVTIGFAAMSSFVGRVPVAGYMLSLLVGLVYLFAPVLRYTEIAKNLPIRLVD